MSSLICKSCVSAFVVVCRCSFALLISQFIRSPPTRSHCFLKTSTKSSNHRLCWIHGPGAMAEFASKACILGSCRFGRYLTQHRGPTLRQKIPKSSQHHSTSTHFTSFYSLWQSLTAFRILDTKFIRSSKVSSWFTEINSWSSVFGHRRPVGVPDCLLHCFYCGWYKASTQNAFPDQSNKGLNWQNLQSKLSRQKSWTVGCSICSLGWSWWSNGCATLLINDQDKHCLLEMQCLICCHWAQSVNSGCDTLLKRVLMHFMQKLQHLQRQKRSCCVQTVNVFRKRWEPDCHLLSRREAADTRTP